jgi:hypothetical protein
MKVPILRRRRPTRRLHLDRLRRDRGPVLLRVRLLLVLVLLTGLLGRGIRGERGHRCDVLRHAGLECLAVLDRWRRGRHCFRLLVLVGLLRLGVSRRWAVVAALEQEDESEGEESQDGNAADHAADNGPDWRLAG